jgi:hypothetical protein
VAGMPKMKVALTSMPKMPCSRCPTRRR